MLRNDSAYLEWIMSSEECKLWMSGTVMEIVKYGIQSLRIIYKRLFRTFYLLWLVEIYLKVEPLSLLALRLKGHEKHVQRNAAQLFVTRARKAPQKAWYFRRIVLLCTIVFQRESKWIFASPVRNIMGVSRFYNLHPLQT